jgi:hypothetical protein
MQTFMTRTTTYTDVREPKWANAEHSAILCRVRFAGSPDHMPFNATPTDPERHGRAIFMRCVAGHFGRIAPYEHPSDDELAARARATRDALLRDSDWSQLPDVPRAIRDIWAEYRQLLREVPEQDRWPSFIYWPQAPK